MTLAQRLAGLLIAGDGADQGVSGQQVLGRSQVVDHGELGVGEVGQHDAAVDPKTADLRSLLDQTIKKRFGVRRVSVGVEQIEQAVGLDPDFEVRGQDVEEGGIDLPLPRQ